MKSVLVLSALVCILVFCFCKSDKKKDKECSLGSPTAIFLDKIPGIKNHNFKSKDQESKESLILPDDVTLEINQSGCEYVNQEFIFTYPDEIKTDSFVTIVDTVILRFNVLAKMHENLKAFSLWSNALIQARPYIHQGEELQLGDGVSIAIDKMNSFKRTSLFIKCFQKPPSTN